MTSKDRCPCGSGKLRGECDDRALVCCVRCDSRYHRTSPRQRFCPPCGIVNARELNTAGMRKLRAAKRVTNASTADAAAVSQTLPTATT